MSSRRGSPACRRCQLLRVYLPWEVTWVKSATSLTLSDPEETLTAESLQKFLAALKATIGGKGFRCTLFMRKGHIHINGVTYPVELVEDKWLGDVLLVHCSGKPCCSPAMEREDSKLEGEISALIVTARLAWEAPLGQT